MVGWDLSRGTWVSGWGLIGVDCVALCSSAREMTGVEILRGRASAIDFTYLYQFVLLAEFVFVRLYLRGMRGFSFSGYPPHGVAGRGKFAVDFGTIRFLDLRKMATFQSEV